MSSIPCLSLRLYKLFTFNFINSIQQFSSSAMCQCHWPFPAFAVAILQFGNIAIQQFSNLAIPQFRSSAMPFVSSYFTIPSTDAGPCVSALPVKYQKPSDKKSKVNIILRSYRIKIFYSIK